MACGRKVVQVDMSSKPDAPHTVYLKQHMSGRCNVSAPHCCCTSVAVAVALHCTAVEY